MVRADANSLLLRSPTAAAHFKALRPETKGQSSQGPPSDRPQTAISGPCLPCCHSGKDLEGHCCQDPERLLQVDGADLILNCITGDHVIVQSREQRNLHSSKRW